MTPKRTTLRDRNREAIAAPPMPTPQESDPTPAPVAVDASARREEAAPQAVTVPRTPRRGGGEDPIVDLGAT